ncbi:hypothetical protein M436DRAFT_68489 [Aureobasidium namibiae CBS 147.97]|uniref:Uncharacterized protein n=1 Tax=Aureobasidium namibiae CBS 147.97 TaxID=1043004 RepID=A0A074W5B5_9PEZI|nr:uncharacterized protein M436DRAFT_68489 [Aureobasidium namibiae CBS 147.97]KEQ68048.1 hypothetical protein M436DRAFT_68489 [Aureobasidium namibiae CBS 147.97]
MLSLLGRSALQFHPSFFISAALAVATAGRAHYSSTTDPEWTPTRQYANKGNEERARRLATDPEYRKRISAKRRVYFERNKAAVYVRHREYIAQNSDKIRAGVVAQRASRDFEKLYYAPKRARWASDDALRQRESLRLWVRKSWAAQDMVAGQEDG